MSVHIYSYKSSGLAKCSCSITSNIRQGIFNKIQPMRTIPQMKARLQNFPNLKIILAC